MDCLRGPDLWVRMMSVEAVLCSDRGLIVAPAGCGKTHLITETLKIAQDKPYLVLTHTTAGVAALKQRLKRLRVPNKQYVVATIDGWARRISMMFPMSCGIAASPDDPKTFYPELRNKVNTYIDSESITDAIQASYSRLLVDEYQDCNADQHWLVCALANLLPTVVFGDPMQCIFNFGGPMPSWRDDIQTKFPVICELNTPWRWINAGTPELGQWILGVRNLLMSGAPIDSLSCPGYVHWHQLSGDYRTDSQNQLKAHYQLRNSSDEADSLLVIGDQFKADRRHDFASMSQGLDVVEPVELTGVTTLASQIDESSGVNLAECILDAVATMMTGVGKAALMKRVPTILAGRNRSPVTHIESAVILVVTQGDTSSIVNLLDCLELGPETKIFRRSAFSALKSAVSLCASDPSKSMRQAAEIIREQRRHQGDRRIPSRAIGSTLLLKGLEADHAFILDAGAMNRQHLYVAISRGAKSITLFSGCNVVGQ